MKRIKLTQNKFVLVDDADYTWLNQWKWCVTSSHSGNFYAMRKSLPENGKRYKISMHRQILSLEKGDRRIGDHINHNTLDNRRSNIRVCTPQQNNMNQKSRPNTTSKYKGVSWNKNLKKWHVRIQINNGLKQLGCFYSEIFAASVYDKAATQEFGEFAYLNFPLTKIEIMIQ